MNRLAGFPGSAPTAVKYLVLLLAVGAAHYPALAQVARADQFIYLYTTRDKVDLHALTLGSYSWNREIGGDVHFFRPVLMFLLGLERWAFSAENFWAWQLTSLLLHLVVVVLLFRWLQGGDDRGSWLAVIVAAFFGVQYACAEFVAWHHLSGYLLFCVFLLGILCLLYRCSEEVSVGRQAALVLLLLLAAFTLEPGNVLSVLVAGCMIAVNVGRRWSPDAGPGFHRLAVLGCLAVPIVYFAANLADQYRRYGHILAGPAHEGCLPLGAGIRGMARAAGLWLQGGFIPSKIDLTADSRMQIGAVHATLSRPLALQCGLVLAGGAAFVLLFARGLRQGLAPRRVLVGVVALLFGLCYTAVLVFLRAGPRGLQDALFNNSYYPYIFNLSVLIFLSSLVDFRALPASWSGRLPRVVLGGALACLAIISGRRVHEQDRAEAQWGEPTRVLVQQVRRLRRAHHNDGDFTFTVAPGHPGELELSYVGSDPDGHTVTVSQALFPRQYTRDNPRYLLWGRYRGFDVVTINGVVVGIPCDTAPLDFAALSPLEDSRCVTGATLGEVEKGIDRLCEGFAFTTL
jgi:hypothetical protein